jgi:CRISPR/Cas system-associated exonuclease Cas4 (RecB family)
VRKAFFSFVHAPKDESPPDPRLQRVFDVGHEGHRRIQGYFFEAWKRGLVKQAWEDVKLSIPELCISGELDGIVEVAEPDRILLEIKTAKSTSFNRIKRPEETWVWQCHVYMEAVGLRAAIILVECKDTQDQKEFWVPFDDELWGQIESRCLALISAAAARLVPVEQDTSGCRFCDYGNVCEQNGDGIDWDDVEENVRFP